MSMTSLPVVRLQEFALGSQRIRFIYYNPVTIGTATVKNVSFTDSDTANAIQNEKTEDFPLFLASDVLTGIDQMTKNHPRVHSRFSKLGLATKLKFSGYRIADINWHHVWFYNIQGLFQAVFEYHNRHMKRECLRLLRGLWLERFEDEPVPEEIEIGKILHEESVRNHDTSVLNSAGPNPNNYDMTWGESSKGDTEEINSGSNQHFTEANLPGTQPSHQINEGGPPIGLSHQGEIQPTSTNSPKTTVPIHPRLHSQGENQLISTNSPKTTAPMHPRLHSQGENQPTSTNSPKTTVPMHRRLHSQPPLEENLYDDKNCTSKLLLPSSTESCENVNVETAGMDNPVSSTDVSNGVINFNLVLQQRLMNLVQLISDQLTKDFSQQETVQFDRMIQLKSVLLYCLADFFRDNYNKDVSFPTTLLKSYTKILCNDSDVPGLVVTDFSNCFDMNWHKNAILCIISEWLGKEFRKLSEKVKSKVSDFKLSNIGHIGSLPPPQSLVQSLFPACMSCLLENWMEVCGTRYLYEYENDQSNVLEHNYFQSEDLSVQVMEQTENNDQFPIIQLILEYTNNSLISGVAHVLYPTLKSGVL